MHLVKALLIEMGEPYLQRLTSNKLAKTVELCIIESNAFRQRMMERLEKSNPTPEVRRSWEGTIEQLSRRQLFQVQQEIMKKINFAGDTIKEQKLNYDDFTSLLSEVNAAVDTWIAERIIKKVAQED
jgi:hypothetical protein